MDRWTCPDCERQFGRVGQGHTCRPGMTVDEYFSQAAGFERPIFDVVEPHLRSRGPLIVDPIDSGILFKHGPVFCQLGRMKRWVALGFQLRRPLDSPRLSRKVSEYNGKFWHVVNVVDPATVDDEILGWLDEAYLHAPEIRAPRVPTGSVGHDPMVPDDIDVEF